MGSAGGGRNRRLTLDNDWFCPTFHPHGPDTRQLDSFDFDIEHVGRIVLRVVVASPKPRVLAVIPMSQAIHVRILVQDK